MQWTPAKDGIQTWSKWFQGMFLNKKLAVCVLFVCLHFFAITQQIYTAHMFFCCFVFLHCVFFFERSNSMEEMTNKNDISTMEIDNEKQNEKTDTKMKRDTQTYPRRLARGQSIATIIFRKAKKELFDEVFCMRALILSVTFAIAAIACFYAFRQVILTYFLLGLCVCVCVCV